MQRIEEIRTGIFLSDAMFCKDKNGKIRFWKAESWHGGFYSHTGNLERNGVYSNLKSNFIIVNSNSIRGISAQIAFEIAARYKTKINSGFKYLSDLNLTYIPEENMYYDNFNNRYEDIYDVLIQRLSKYKSDNKGFLKPMLAHKYKRDTLKYPMIAQPKINGIRGLLRWGEKETGDGMFKKVEEGPIFTSREGNVYNLPNLESWFTKDMFLARGGEELVYDGELYCHGKTLNYIRSCCPMILDNGTISVPSGNPDNLQFWIFDLANLIQQDERLYILRNKLKGFIINDITENEIKQIGNKKIVRVPWIYVDSDTDAEMYAERCIKYGFEGAILRDMESLYNFGVRSKSLIKLKRINHTECKIIDVIPKDREPDTALFVLKNDINNETFQCNPMGTYAERKEYLDNRDNYIGKLAIVKYYERSGVEKVPFHANVETIRDYE